MTEEQEQILKTQFVNLTFSREWKEKLDAPNYSDKELIWYCLKKAWPDAIIYVRKKNTPGDEEIMRHEKDIKDAVYKSIINAEWKDDFDKWHDGLCQKQDYGMRYGVWQKYINMCFKYLYCINDRLSSPLSIDFTKCHIPLDDNTLLWCRNNCITQVTAWNSISRDDYIAIRNGVRSIIQKSSNLSGALQLDFIVWRVKKVCDVLLSIKNLKDDLVGLENYHNWFTSCGFDINDNKETRGLLTKMDALKSYVLQKQEAFDVNEQIINE